MNFELSEDDALLVDNVRQFCRQVVLPDAGAWDEAEAIPESVFNQLGELGLLGLEVPDAHGGVELSTVAAAAVIQELAAASGALALGVGSHNSLATGHIQHFGSSEQRERWLPALAAGQHLGAWALTEPNAGTDVGAIKTTARRDGDGWVIDGTKTYVTHGGIAGLHVVIASTDPGAGTRGLTAFVVETGTPGLETGQRIQTLGMRASNTTAVRLSGVAVDDSQRIGEPGTAFKAALSLLDRGRINVAAVSCGLLRAAMEAGRDYSSERKQFNRPISAFQAIQWKLANMATDLDAGWLLTLKAAALRDAGRSFGAEAARAKVYASEAATRGASEALQIHGGYGYTREFAAERYLRDSKGCQIAEGMGDALRVVISRGIVRQFAEA